MPMTQIIETYFQLLRQAIGAANDAPNATNSKTAN